MQYVYAYSLQNYEHLNSVFTDSKFKALKKIRLWKTNTDASGTFK